MVGWGLAVIFRKGKQLRFNAIASKLAGNAASLKAIVIQSARLCAGQAE
jgi:hypothetical protein